MLGLSVCSLRLLEPLFPDELGVTGLHFDPYLPDPLGVDLAISAPNDMGVPGSPFELDIPESLGLGEEWANGSPDELRLPGALGEDRALEDALDSVRPDKALKEVDLATVELGDTVPDRPESILLVLSWDWLEVVLSLRGVS